MSPLVQLGDALRYPITKIGYLSFDDAVIHYPYISGACWRVALFLDRHAQVEGRGSSLVPVCNVSVDKLALAVDLPASEVIANLHMLAKTKLIASLDERYRGNHSVRLIIVIAGY